MYKGYIYKYTFPNGKVYIGQTRREQGVREAEHIDPVKGPTNPGFWNAYQKFGKYEYEILKFVERPTEDALVRALTGWEDWYIFHTNAYDPEFGLNKRMSSGVHLPSETLKKKMIEESWQEKANEIVSIVYSTFDKIKERKGPLNKEELAFFNECILSNNKRKERLKRFSIKHLDKNTDIMIDICLDMINKNAQSYLNEKWRKHWEYYTKHADEFFEKYKYEHAIYKLSMDGELLKLYDDMNDVAREMGGCKKANITRALTGKLKSAYGFLWCYRKDLSKFLK